MGAFIKGVHDPEFDEHSKAFSKQVARPRVTLLLVGIALVCLAWATVSAVLFFRAEHRHLAREFSPSKSPMELMTLSHGPRPSVQRPLLEFVPNPLRRDLPRSELDVAADLRAVEERGGDGLWLTHLSGITRGAAYDQVMKPLKRRLVPCWEIDGWLMRFGWQGLGLNGTDLRYDFRDAPPVRMVSLDFPDHLAGYEVTLQGLNYDFQTGERTCPNERIERLERGDWVKVTGMLHPRSQPEWMTGKGEDVLILGELTIWDIQKVYPLQNGSPTR